MTKLELIKKAEDYELNNDWQSALDMYEALLNHSPDEILFTEKVAWCASRLSKYKHAINYYTLLTEKEPQSAKWCYCVGYQYYMQKDWNSANKWFEKALILYPEYLVVKYRYAYSLRQLCGSMKILKREEFWKALNLLSECDTIWNSYTTKQKKQNEITYAAICFQHAKLLIDRNHIEEAINYLEKAISIKQNDEEYRYQLSKSYLTIGNIEKAKEVFPINSEKYYVKELKVDILIAEKKHFEAIEEYNILLKYRKRDYLYRELGMQYYEVNNLQDAISCMLQAEKINSKNHLTQFAKAKVLFKAGFLVSALNAAEIAASIKKEKYLSEYTEAIEFSKLIQKLMENESYKSDNYDELKTFLNQPVGVKINSRIIGKVLSYNTDRGYGFIEYDYTRYFFHISNVHKCLQDKIVDGMMLSFLPVKTEKGLSATNINIEN